MLIESRASDILLGFRKEEARDIERLRASVSCDFFVCVNARLGIIGASSLEEVLPLPGLPK